MSFARAADEVFDAFGYGDPTRVDICKTSAAHRKRHAIPWTWKNRADLWY